MTPTRFFESAFPQMAAEHFDAFLSAKGTISISVKSEGKWTLKLGDIDEPVAQGFDHDADLRMWFTKDAFESFVDGSLDEVEAVEQAEIFAEGDVQLLETVGYMLRPNTSVLNVFIGG